MDRPKQLSEQEPKKEGSKWGETVESYFEAEDITNEEVNFPAIVRGLDGIEGQVILDYGCGNGRFSRKIEEMGATRVIGVDKEQSMIDLTKVADSESKVEYYANPDNTLFFLEDESVDKVMANLVFMMCPTKQEMQQSFREIYRVLKKDGTFVYLITHPAFIERAALDYRNEFDGSFDYFKEEKPYRFILKDAHGKEIDEKFYDYHYTLTTYLNMAMQSGFVVTGVEEITYSDPRVIEKYQITKELQTFPQSIMITGKKLKVEK